MGEGHSFAGGFGSFGHLAWRFATSLDPRGPSPADDHWAREQLSSGERQLWDRMSGPDRRHAVGVARDAGKLLGGDGVSTEVYEAALMHDVGKVDSQLGTFSRVAVTVLTMGLSSGRVRGWYRPQGKGIRRRCGAYVSHDKIGAGLLEQAGASELAITWARQHHTPQATWTVEPRTAQALKEADGD